MGNPWPNFELALQKVAVLLLKWKVFAEYGQSLAKF